MTVYTNAIGELSPKAQVVRVRVAARKIFDRERGLVAVPASEHWSWCCESDAPEPALPSEATAEEIAANLEAAGWDCEIRLNGYNLPEIWATHRETEQVLREAAAKAEATFSGAERGYVRYGELPRGGRSYNYRDNCYEAGVSCIPAEFAADGSWRLITNGVTKVDALAYEAKGVHPYRVWGIEVGTGSDGEPLLKVERCEAL